MIAVDTNVIVRFLVRDDAKQAQRVYTRLKRAEANGERFLVPLAVLLETIWVLDSAYGKSRKDILDAVQDMRQMPVFEFERDEVVERVVADGRKTRADLADLLIAHSAQSSGCESGITLDKRAARLPFSRLLS